MAANTAMQGVMNASIFATFDAGKPHIESELTARYGTQYASTFMKLVRSGREIPIAAETWKAYEDNWYHDTITTSGTTSAVGAGANLDITLDTSGKPTTSDYYLKVGDIIMMPTTEVLGWCSAIDVTTPTAPVATFIPVDQTQNLAPSDIASGTSISIVTQAFAQGTGQPDGTLVGFTEREFQLQIIKTTTGLDGSQYAQDYWFDKYENGSVVGYFTTGTLRMEYQWKRNLDGAMLVGTQNNNANLVQERVNVHNQGTGKYATVRTSDGLLPLIRSRGNTDALTPGTYDIEDLDDQGLYLRSQGVLSSVVWTPAGAQAFNDIQNGAKDYAVDDTGDGSLINQVMTNMAKGNKEVATSLNFSYISRGGWTYALDVIDGFSNPKTFANTNYNFDQKMLFIPLKKMRDSMSGESIDNIALGYRAKDGYSRKAEVWSVRGAGGVTRGTYQTSVDRSEYYMRGEVGLQAMAVNQMTLGE